MESGGSAFTSSPEAKSPLGTPPQDAAEGLQEFLSSLSLHQRFRSSANETSNEHWERSLAANAARHVQVSDWDEENPFYKQHVGTQGSRDHENFGVQSQLGFARSHLEGIDRAQGANSTGPVQMPLRLRQGPPNDSDAQISASRISRAPLPLDLFNQLQPPQLTSSPSSATSSSWSSTPTRHMIINVPPNIEHAALKKFLSVSINIIQVSCSIC